MGRNPSVDEAAAIAAAVARFQAETASVEKPAEEAVSSWQRAALLEGVGAKSVVRKHLEGGAQWQS